MAENSILLELNITAKDTRKSLDNVTASLKKLRGESERAIAKLRGLTQSLNISKTAAGKLSSELDAISTKFALIATNAGLATNSLKNFAKVSKVAPKSDKPAIKTPVANVSATPTPSQDATIGATPQVDSTAASSLKEQATTAAQASSALKNLGNAMQVAAGKTGALKTALSVAAKVSSSVSKNIRKTASGLFNYAKETIKAKRATDKHSGALGKLTAALGRVAFYRAIRALLKEITQAVREGVNNLTLYSQALNNLDSSHANQTMSEFATIALYVKNTLGAMVMPVLQALVPVVNAIANAFVAAANAVNQFFHALKGETVFTKARKYAVDYADGLDSASGSAKELKKQVFGFDELNIFDAPSNGGRGGGAEALDYSKMFEESPVASWIQKIANDANWESLGAIFAMRVNSAIGRFNAESAGTNLGKKIQAVVGTAFGFLENFNFKRVGSKLAVGLNNMIAEIKWEEIGHIFATKFTAIFDFLIGFITDFDFGQVANAISQVIIGFFDHLSEWLDEVDWQTFGNTFFDKVYEFVTGIDFGGIARSFFEFFGSALGSAWEFARGFVSNLFQKVSDYFHEKTEECGGNSVLGLLKGIADALVGIFGWIVDNVWTPFWSGLLKAFGIDAGVSSNMTEIGAAVVDGFFAGLKSAWKSIADWISQKANAVKTAFRGIIDGVKKFDAKSPRQLDFGTPVGLYAEGGQPQTGSLFYAGEAGAELVGQVGGRTTVTTHDQFSEGMADIMDNTNTVILQAAQALIQAIQSKPVPSIQIGDRDIVSMYDRGKTLAGSALVE